MTSTHEEDLPCLAAAAVALHSYVYHPGALHHHPAWLIHAVERWSGGWGESASDSYLQVNHSSWSTIALGTIALEPPSTASSGRFATPYVPYPYVMDHHGTSRAAADQ